MNILYLSNSGLLIETGGIKILIDGLFSDNNPFDSMNNELEVRIFSARGDFSAIDYLIFTHCHDDHFDGMKVQRYMKFNPAVKVIVPRDALQNQHFREVSVEEGNRIYYLDRENQSYDLKNQQLKLDCFKTKHLENQISECEDHYSILLTNEKKRIFIAGDLELNDEEFLRLFKDKRFDLVVFNPVVLFKKKWIENFTSIIARRKVIYHIPSEKNDRFYYRKMTRYNFGLLNQNLHDSQLLLHEMEKL